MTKRKLSRLAKAESKLKYSTLAGRRVMMAQSRLLLIAMVAFAASVALNIVQLIWG